MAYLIYNDKVQNREKMADLLWNASSTRQSLNRLRELLVRVRKWLPHVITTRQTITFQADEGSFVDLFVLRQGLADEDISHLDEALQLYGRRFPGRFSFRGCNLF